MRPLGLSAAFEAAVWAAGAAALVLTGCGGGDAAKPEPAKAKAPAKKQAAPAAAKPPDAAAAPTDGAKPGGDPEWKNGREALAAYEAWYAEHATDFDGGKEFLKRIMQAFGGSKFAAEARMRMKDLERDRERAAGDWYAAAHKTALAKLQAADIDGALAALADVPEPYRVTSFGAQAKQWPSECIAWVRTQVTTRLDTAARQLKQNDPAAARAAIDEARALAASARSAFAPQIAAELNAAIEKRNTAIEAAIAAAQKLQALQEAIGPLVQECRAAIAAKDFAKAFEIAKAIRAKAGPPEPGETGLRREAEELWITAATAVSDLPKQFAPGVARKTPTGARLIYDFGAETQLGDWEISAKPRPRVADGLLVLPKDAMAVHRARFPRRAEVHAQAPPGAVVVALFGRYRVGLWVGRLARITRDDTELGQADLTRNPTKLANPATIVLIRNGDTVSVAWGGEAILTVVDPEPPADAEVNRVAFHGGSKGSRLHGVTIIGSPELAKPEPVVVPEDTEPEEAPPLPKGWQKLKPPGSGLPGWTAKGHGQWSSRQQVEILFDGGRKRQRLSTLVATAPSAVKYTEYEFVCEARFVKHRQGSHAGLMFPLGEATVLWCFDNERGAELLGLPGVNVRGNLAEGTQQWVPIKVKVKDGKATGYLGRGKAWEVKLDKVTPATPEKLPQTGLGLVSYGGVAVFRNPAVKYYK